MKFSTRRLYFTPVLAILLLASFSVQAQQDTLRSLKKQFDSFRSSVLQEKIYGHLDRSFYLTGETMWFRLYYVDASFHRPLNVSKVGYVEILDRDNKSVAQAKIALDNGGGYGSIFISSSLPSENYTVRAYTNWMKNFGPEVFFQQQITIINPFTKLGLAEKKAQTSYDVQFLPEGGNLVEDLSNRIGVRCVDPAGRGVDFHGAVVNEQNDTVARFSSHKFGLGSFVFTPKADHQYGAVVYLKNQPAKKIAFPVAAKEGYAVSVNDAGEQLDVSISSRNATGNQPYCYVVTHTRQKTFESKVVFLENGSGKTTLKKSPGTEGITHITVFNTLGQPVAERLTFTPPKKNIVKIQSNQASYAKRKKITLAAASADINNAALSLSVYRLDTLNGPSAADISTYLWLTSELKGRVESPEFYFEDHGAEGKQALDNLLLTHGWSRYSWNDVQKKRSFDFIPELRGHIVTGSVSGTDLGNGKRVTVYLSNPDKNIRLYPSRSNAAGQVKFELSDFYGPRKLIAQTNTQIDSIYDIKIASPFLTAYAAGKPLAFDFEKSLAPPTTQRSLYMQVQNTFHEPASDRYFIPSKDTTAFYGKPDESYWLDDYTRFPTMEEVMREYVPGVRVRKRKNHFYFMNMDTRNQSMFKGNPLVLLDGVPVFNVDRIIALDPLKVKKLEVMTRKYFLGPLSFDGITSYTTYTGDLSDFELDRRALVIDYEGLQQYREFFSPVYETEAQQNDRVPDVRHLLYWNPNLKTDASGNASCSFYTPDVAGTYQVVVQGLGADGKAASGRSLFVVK